MVFSYIFYFNSIGLDFFLQESDKFCGLIKNVLDLVQKEDLVSEEFLICVQFFKYLTHVRSLE